MSDAPLHEVFLVPANFATIQAAVDAVVRPSTIVVDPGDYAESIRVVSKEYLVIQSARLSRRGVTLTGAGTGSVVTVEGSAFHLSGIEIRSRGAARGMHVADSTISLQECVIAGNRVSGGGEPLGAGMLCRRSSVHLQKSVISANTVKCDSFDVAGGGGLFLEDCRSEIAGCTIQINEVLAGGEARGGGIWCERTKLRMWKSRVTDNALRGASCAGGGIYFREPADTQIGGSVITGNGSAEGRGGGVFIADGAAAVSIHANTFVRQNHPDDVVRG
jgi:nitrous oxidase accessory protein NosD